MPGETTRFLPFNRGSDPGAVRCGAGTRSTHPATAPATSGTRLEKERFLDILCSYVFLETREEKVDDAKGARTEKRDTVIFPRYHQLDPVNKLVATAKADGPGRNYLIQHSAGRQDEQHLLAVAPPREPPQRRRREGLRLCHRHH